MNNEKHCKVYTVKEIQEMLKILPPRITFWILAKFFPTIPPKLMFVEVSIFSLTTLRFATTVETKLGLLNVSNPL